MMFMLLLIAAAATVDSIYEQIMDNKPGFVRCNHKVLSGYFALHLVLPLLNDLIVSKLLMALRLSHMHHQLHLSHVHLSHQQS